MHDGEKTKDELILELKELRRQLAVAGQSRTLDIEPQTGQSRRCADQGVAGRETTKRTTVP